MKILEAQSATLTNYEVYQHLVEQKERHLKLKGNKQKGRRPGNLETVVKEVNIDLYIDFNAYREYPVTRLPHRSSVASWLSAFSLQ